MSGQSELPLLLSSEVFKTKKWQKKFTAVLKRLALFVLSQIHFLRKLKHHGNDTYHVLLFIRVAALTIRRLILIQIVHFI